MKEKAPRESEAALVICGVDPQETARRIHGLREIAGYALRQRELLEIRDDYYDTPDGRLRTVKAALRIRRIAGGKPVTLVTLKSKSAPAGPWRNERQEIELPWSVQALRRVLDALAELGIRLVGVPFESPALELPQSMLAALGLQVVQRRNTRRTPMDVIAPYGTADDVVAELSTDAVGFELGGTPVELNEVEIEAKSPGGNRAVDAITSGLLDKFAGELRPWPHSKLATGNAIERLMREGRLAASVRLGPLDASTFDEIAHAIETEE